MKDMTILIGGFLTGLLLFLGTIGISFDWFTKESIDAFVVLFAAGAALFINIYAVWKNTYVSKKGKVQDRALKRQNLK
ncbi:phage holin [Bacillus testis]|uniref:phage holin n=1 Tax=Bacillus testis TaxID=1622072 RepID=UPI00067F5826|nr:phage holin [Bacillus testis]